MGKKPTPRLDPKDRDPIPMQDLEDAVLQMIDTPAGKTKSENREPTKKELKKRYKLVRR